MARVSTPAGKPLETRSSRAVAAPAIDYAPGHFTELIRLHNWPPMFASKWTERVRWAEMSDISRINREKRVAMGDTGTMVGLSAKSDAAILARRG